MAAIVSSEYPNQVCEFLQTRRYLNGFDEQSIKPVDSHERGQVGAMDISDVSGKECHLSNDLFRISGC